MNYSDNYHSLSHQRGTREKIIPGKKYEQEGVKGFMAFPSLTSCGVSYCHEFIRKGINKVDKGGRKDEGREKKWKNKIMMMILRQKKEEKEA